MSRSPVSDSSALVPTATDDARVARAEELYLAPVEGLPRWLGRFWARIAMRFVSMEEQPDANMSGPLSPVRGYFRRDRHVHPTVDPETYVLRVSGVAKPRSFDLAELAALPQEERVCVQECAGNGNHMMGSAGLIGQARWRGPSLKTVLDACGGPGESSNFVFRGRDTLGILKKGYHYGLSLEELTQARALLALTMNGEPLSKRHGFPCRLIVPRVYSMSHVKWLCDIQGKTEPHRGIHNTFVFVNKEKRDGKWVKVQARWIGLKSMVTRCVRVSDGWELHGWAWGGERPIERVEVSTDGGETWETAELRDARESRELADVPDEAFHGSWYTFSMRWRPGSGRYRVASRAHDVDGTPQIMELDPNVKGHFNQCQVKWRDVVVP
jgi:DMSO/TMAO reductase YedYZ molybdopterin-dependent catalytic subunit